MINYVSGNELSDDDTFTHFALFSYCGPTSFEEVAKDKKWQSAMDEEIKSSEKNNTQELMDLSHGHKSIGVKWVFKTKLQQDGSIDKYKV